MTPSPSREQEDLGLARGRYSNSRELADRFGVGTAVVRQIAKGQHWTSQSALAPNAEPRA